MNKVHYKLFNAGPQKTSLGFTSQEVEAQLTKFCDQVRQQIGQGKFITLFPHRVVQNHWAIELTGDQNSIHLLLNVTGRSLLPTSANSEWPARLVIEMADHVDAYWFAIFLAQKLNLQTTHIPLSTTVGDKSVHNAGKDSNG